MGVWGVDEAAPDLALVSGPGAPAS
jgi:hypothetical protein